MKTYLAFIWGLHLSFSYFGREIFLMNTRVIWFAKTNGQDIPSFADCQLQEIPCLKRGKSRNRAFQHVLRLPDETRDKNHAFIKN
jgi:hypothetical protein